MESAKQPDAITRKTPSTAQHLCPSSALHTKGKEEKGRKGAYKIVKGKVHIPEKVHIKLLKDIYLKGTPTQIKKPKT